MYNKRSPSIFQIFITRVAKPNKNSFEQTKGEPIVLGCHQTKRIPFPLSSSGVLKLSTQINTILLPSKDVIIARPDRLTHNLGHLVL